MRDVEYSKDAVNVLNRFHRCKKLVYVEGDDDILFWETLFQHFKLVDIKIEVKDGSSELDKYTERLISEDLNIIIARDSDYKVLSGKIPKHNRIITTYGYSIENTLYLPRSVIEITKLWIRDSSLDSSIFEQWMSGISQHLEELISFDIANEYYELYIDVIGDNCTRYMKTQSCDNLDLNKIAAHIKKLKPQFSNEQITFSSELISKSGIDLNEIMRGHFLQSAVLKFISNQINKKGLSYKLSHSALYTNAIQELKTTFDYTHKHFEHYSSSITKLIDYP
jgi:hypothetical protein